MANLSKTHTLFGFTSPRTIEKIIPEIRLLIDKHEGEKWSGNPELQAKFFSELFNSEFYEGGKPPKDATLAARDRITRAPKAFGFVDLKPSIQLTEVGQRLLEEKRLNDTITRQLLKFQLPSPYHNGFPEPFFVRPYLELIRLIRVTGSLSKTEIALFFSQLTSIEKFDMVVEKIYQFRKNAKDIKVSRKTYVHDCFIREITHIFKDEIKRNKLSTRESDDDSIEKFIQTKKSNMNDYADAFVRYIRATQLVTFQKGTYRIIIAASKEKEVDYILNRVPREPIDFKDEKEFKAYLFSATNIKLLNDDEKLLGNKLKTLGCKIDEKKYGLEELKDKLEELEKQILSENIAQTTKELKTYKEFDDIMSIFGKISDKKIPDPPLFLEWNVWRALVMLNHSKRADGNFTIDLDGMPLNTAPGKKPDIEIEFEDFNVIVEVTMSSGETQYKMEGESVPRHFGDVKLKTEKDTYCIFIAPKISNGTLAHYFNLNKMNTKLYGGRTKIVPMNIGQFVEFVRVGKENGFDNPEKLKNWLEALCEYNQGCEDEEKWYSCISERICNWAV